MKKEIVFNENWMYIPVCDISITNGTCEGIKNGSSNAESTKQVSTCGT